MEVASALAAAGVWPAVALTGHLAFTRTWRGDGAALVTSWALLAVAGLAMWSVPLLGSVVLGVYQPVYVGMAGWCITVLGSAALWRRAARRERPAGRNAMWDRVLVAGLVLAGCLYLGFPTESIYGGRDEGVYANHAVYMAHHGRLDVPYPWPAAAGDIFVNGWGGFPGFYNTPGTMTVQFGHLFPVWLAQAYATFGQHGLFRLNAIFALLALAVVYDVFEMAAGAPCAVVATLFLAFNPSELWMARITLSEILTQLFTWSGLCLLLRALRQDSPGLARWAGVCLGVSALVRFDSLFLLPMLLLAHAGYRVVAAPPSRSGSVWMAMYTTALPLFALAVGYFLVFSRPYLNERPYVQTLAVATGIAAALLLALHPVIIASIRPWIRHQAVLVVLGAGLAALAAYAYWIRPLPVAPPRMAYQFPGFYIDLNKGDYRTESLVDLARYLSPVVVWAAIAGWYVSLWRVARGECEAYLAVPVVLIAGFSLAYLYAPSNTPDHLWWVRRFTPVVVPGFVLYATVAVRRLLQTLPSHWSTAAAIATVTFLVAFTVRTDALILTFAEDEGLYAQLSRLADKLPAGVPIVAHGHKFWLTPLYLAFDRLVVPMDLNSADGQRALRAWSAQRAAAHEPVYVLSEVDENVQAPDPNDVIVSRLTTEPSIGRLPEHTIIVKARFRVAKLPKPELIVLPPPAYEHTDHH